MLKIESHAITPAMTDTYLIDENVWVNHLIDELGTVDAAAQSRISEHAQLLVSQIRKHSLNKNSIDALLHEYDLSSDEGIALMCLAEAFLRIPDRATVDRLLRDKITAADWQKHISQEKLLWVNAANWGLLLTGKVLAPAQDSAMRLKHIFKQLLQRTGEPLIRTGVQQLMKRLSRQFVMGDTIESALKRARSYEEKGFTYSYDMLGEAAYTQTDADTYYQAYQHAIETIGNSHHEPNVNLAPGISIKLSALHPRYELTQYKRVVEELTPRVLELALLAKKHNIGLTIDAEESARLELSLAIFEKVFSNPALADWHGLGLAVQAYQKRAISVIDWLLELATREKKRIMLRLVKGAYWDTEIKLAQEQGLTEYPVFTRKANTDISYLACARRILANPEAFYGQFATHNAYSIAAISEFAQNNQDMEFQCLHGMGHNLYDHIIGQETMDLRCRIYAPVGSYEDLLPYLVRRLLENGANSSFVNRITDENEPISKLIADPVAKMSGFADKHHPQIPLPHHIYGITRLNSNGVNLTHHGELHDLQQGMQNALGQAHLWEAKSIVASKVSSNEANPMYAPFDTREQIGNAYKVKGEDAKLALDLAQLAFGKWQATSAEHRAECLLKAADLLEAKRYEFMALAIREAGKTINDAVAEVREAIDFLRYYAEQARLHLQDPLVMPGPTGEYNQLSLQGRGIIVCISPWNFPLAIFLGQVSAALVAGNCVVAKPADQTPLIAHHAVKLLHAAGIPKDVLQLLLGSGRDVGQAMISDERIAGVMFTGSTQTAQHINKTLAARQGSIVPFIAETGGQNAMLVDSSALPEQVTLDVITSAFGSAGQRCSALRILFLQEEIADKVITMLQGAMAELVVGDPQNLRTDIGPVIDQGALNMLQRHFAEMQTQGKLIYQCELDAEQTQNGTFFAPCAFEIPSLEILREEIFGPFLHVIRYKKQNLDKVLADINNTGFGLTLGIHSRINETADYIYKHLNIGNTYVNRNMIGATVGVQPFGGQGLSGTGPKAGGPHYILRLCNERTLTINTSATGGNTSLMSLED